MSLAQGMPRPDAFMTTLDGLAAVSTSRSSRQATISLPTANVAVLSLYGTAHVLVDATCAAVVFTLVFQTGVSGETVAGLMLLYHALAFGLQPFFGLAVDATKTPRLAAMLGCLVSALALLFAPWPVIAVALAGVGNAVFHVGGGIVSLRITPQRATAPGLFVAPGSIGLLLGAILGQSGPLPIAALLCAAVVVSLLLICLPVPRPEPVAACPCPVHRAELILALILLSIAVRSLVGFLVSFPWKTEPVLLVALTLATVLGKSLGGFLADRWGWVRVGMGSMLAALPFLACASTFPAAAIPGMMLLNFTMPITLAATAQALPGRPGFAFGLTCLAYLLGILPPLLGFSANGPIYVVLVVLLSLWALHRGLRWLSFDRCLSETLQVSK